MHDHDSLDICFPDINKPPKANAGGDQTIALPTKLVVLDGSQSSDDRGIFSYLWTRDSTSLAVGVCMIGVYLVTCGQETPLV